MFQDPPRWIFTPEISALKFSRVAPIIKGWSRSILKTMKPVLSIKILRVLIIAVCWSHCPLGLGNEPINQHKQPLLSDDTVVKPLSISALTLETLPGSNRYKDYDIVPYLYALSEGKKPLGHISSLWHQNKHFPSNSDILFSSKPFWAIFVVENPTDKIQKMYFHQKLPLQSLSIQQIPNDQNTINLKNMELEHYQRHNMSQNILLEMPPGKSTFVVGFVTHNFLTIFAPRLLTLESYDVDFFYSNLILMFLYGGLAGLWIYNFAFVSIARLRQFTYFLISGIGIVAVPLSLLGVPPDLSDILPKQIHSLWPLWVALIAFGVSRFTLEFFAHGKTQNPVFFKATRLINNSYPLLASLFFISENFAILIPLIIITASALGITYIVRFGLPPSKIDAIVYLANAIPFGLCGTYLSCQYMGILPYIQTSFLVFVVISVVFLLLSSVSTTTFIVAEKIAGEKLQQSLELARNVQNLLLPSDKSGKVGPFHFAYEQHSNQETIAGEWIYYWKTRDNTLHVMIGHISQGGPQAALIISAAFMALERIKHQNATLDLGLQHLNQTLFQMFSGQGKATVLGISLSNTGLVTLCNAGSIGIYLHQLGHTQILSTHGPTLGTSPICTPIRKTLTLTSGDLLIVPSQGLERPTTFLHPRLEKTLKTNSSLDAQDLCSHLLKFFRRDRKSQMIFAIQGMQS